MAKNQLWPKINFLGVFYQWLSHFEIVTLLIVHPRSDHLALLVLSVSASLSLLYLYTSLPFLSIFLCHSFYPLSFFLPLFFFLIVSFIIYVLYIRLFYNHFWRNSRSIPTLDLVKILTKKQQFWILWWKRYNENFWYFWLAKSLKR